MRKKYISCPIYLAIQNERGIFLPISLLFFSIVFIVTFQTAVHLSRDVSYHGLQVDWMRNKYLMTAGTKETVALINAGNIERDSGEWIYESGKVKYQIMDQKAGDYKVRLTSVSGSSSKTVLFVYSIESGKMIKWEEKY